MNLAKKFFGIWILFLFIVTFLCSLTYLVAQQSIRLGANELPVQMATDMAIKLQGSSSSQPTISDPKVDISKSLSPFVMVYDRKMNLLATSAMMGSSEPSYPKGVLDDAAQTGEDRVTWQPLEGLRFATIAIKSNNGFIVAGRSLRETEKLIDSIGRMVLLAWIACMFCSGAALAVIYAFLRKTSQK